MNLEDKVKAMVAALEDIKARDILVLDTATLTSLFERVIIASSESARQTRSLARSVHDKAAELGLHIIGMEGEEGAEWILVDLGDIVVHVMQPAAREYYNLEELWGVGGMSSKQGPHEMGMRTTATSPQGAGRHEVAVPRDARDGPKARNATRRRRNEV